MKKSIKAVVLFSASLAVMSLGVSTLNNHNTDAKVRNTKAAKIIKTKKYKFNRLAKVQKKSGYIYTSPTTLKHKTKVSKYYKHYTAVGNRVTVKRISKGKIKKQSFTYVKDLDNKKNKSGWVLTSKLGKLKTMNQLYQEQFGFVPGQGHNSGSTSNSSKPSTSTQKYYNGSEVSNYLQEHYLQFMNEERSKVGAPQAQIDPYIQKISERRAYQLAVQGSNGHSDDPDEGGKVHRNSKGHIIPMSLVVGNRLGYFNLDTNYVLDESFSSSFTMPVSGKGVPQSNLNKIMSAFKEMILDDAESDWGHRKQQLDPELSHVGVAAYYNEKEENVSIFINSMKTPLTQSPYYTGAPLNSSYDVSKGEGSSSKSSTTSNKTNSSSNNSSNQTDPNHYNPNKKKYTTDDQGNKVILDQNGNQIGTW